MTTIDQIKKQYDKLTPRERFALIVAAGARDDIAERDALVNSAPKKAWKIVSHYGIVQGFDFASMFYMIDQLGALTSMYFMMAGSTPGNDGKKYTHIKHDGKEFSINFDDYGNKVIRRVLVNYMAWLRLCNEYKIDGDVLLKPLPHYEIMQLMIAICDGAAGMIGPEAQPSEEEVQGTFESMRAVIKKTCKEWE